MYKGGDNSDLNIYRLKSKPPCLSDSVQLAVDNLQLSFSAQDALVTLKLVLNASKTKFILFSLESLSINSIRLDEIFTFKYHIENLIIKLRQKVGFLYRNRSSFPLSCRKSIVEQVFLLVLDYGDVIYRHAAASTLKPLDSFCPQIH